MKNEKPLTQLDWLRVFIFWGILTGITFLVRNMPFFWDNILLSSKYAHHFLENGHNSLLVDPDIDCGHPTLFGMYLSFAWKFFGYTLSVAHFAMLPFLFLLSFSYYKIQKYFVSKSLLSISLLFFLCEPSLMAQCTMVTSEIVMLSGLLWGISAILYDKRFQLVVATLMMASVSLRGAIMVFILYVIGMIFYKVRDQKIKFNLALYFIPSFIFFTIWNIYHYKHTGWYLVGGNPKWAEHYQTVGLKDILKNCLLIVRNLLDFGRIFLWMTMFSLSIIYYKKIKELCGKKKVSVLFIFIASITLFSLFVIFIANPIGHRYMMLWYILAIVLLLQASEAIKPTLLRKGTLILTAMFVLTGNLWIYPDKIAQGWDSTLGHLPYFSLREKAFNYIEEQGLENDRIGAGFMLHSDARFVDLKTRTFSIEDKEIGIEKFDYILYSNINNDYSDQEIDDLHKKWVLEKEFCFRDLCVKLFRRNNFL